MKILIDFGGYEFLNFGDTAMLQVAVKRFEQFFPDAEISVFNVSPELLKKYCPNAISVPKELTIEGRWGWKMRWNIFGGLYKLIPGEHLKKSLALFEFKLIISFPEWVRPWIKWRLNRKGHDITSMNAVLDLIRSADIVVATGGGYITDSFELHARRVLMTLALASSLGKPTALFGQGIGPIKDNYLADIARYCFQKIDLICIREAKESLSLLKEYNVPEDNIIITGDDAIEFAYAYRPQLLGKDIGINIRIAFYSDLDDSIVSSIKPLLLKAKENYGAKLRAIPISGFDEESDAASIKRVFSGILDSDAGHFTSPEDVITEVGLCRIVITGSYHGAVFALSQGISVVCLASSEYYQHKFQGLADQFTCGCYIVNMKDDNFANIFESLLDQAWHSANSISNKLLAEANKQIILGKDAYHSFAYKVKCNYMLKDNK